MKPQFFILNNLMFKSTTMRLRRGRMFWSGLGLNPQPLRPVSFGLTTQPLLPFVASMWSVLALWSAGKQQDAGQVAFHQPQGGRSQEQVTHQQVPAGAEWAQQEWRQRWQQGSQSRGTTHPGTHLPHAAAVSGWVGVPVLVTAETHPSNLHPPNPPQCFAEFFFPTENWNWMYEGKMQ